MFSMTYSHFKVQAAIQKLGNSFDSSKRGVVRICKTLNIRLLGLVFNRVDMYSDCVELGHRSPDLGIDYDSQPPNLV